MYAFETMRPMQVKVIDRIMEAFEDYDYVMLEMPPGIGKSGVAMSVALSMNEHGSTSYINTSSKLLQDQYLNDFKFTRTIKGRANFDCTDPDTDERIRQKCDTGRCVLQAGYPCTVKPKKDDFIAIDRGLKKERLEYNGSIAEDKMCPYFKQKFQGLKAGHVVSNYSYFFSLYYYTGELAKRNLLVFDEAHNLEDEIFKFVSLVIVPEYYNRFAKILMTEFLSSKGVTVPDVPLDTDMVIVWSEYLRLTILWMEAVWKFYDGDEKVGIGDGTPDYEQGGISNTLIKFGEALKKAKYIHSLISKNYNNWIVDFNYNGKMLLSIKLSPIETGQYVRELFSLADKTLFVSATLLDKSVYADMIGIPEDKIAFIQELHSPFPVHNRYIRLENIGDLNYRNMDRMLPKIVTEIDKILDDHFTDKGIIHCTNYKQVSYIRDNISRRNKERLTLTKSGTQQADVMKVHNNKENSVLLSPSMDEGVDLVDSLSRFQIIVKIPYLPLNDRRIKKKMNKNPTWYDWHACLKLMQMYGRSIRNENDYAVTYILDSKVNDLIKNKFITGWFKEAIV